MKKIKKNFMRFTCKLFLGLALMLLLGMTAEAKTTKWTSLGDQWYANKKVYYINGNTLYASPNQPHSMGVRKKIATWKINKYEDLRIVNGYKNKLYVSRDSKAILYSVDVKTKKKVKVASNCSVFATKGQYIYGNKTNVTDTGAYPVSVWKIKDKSVKKVKTLGKYIFGTTVVGKHIYYGKYKSSSQKKVTIYRANLNGSRPKKLFTVSGKGEYVQSLLNSVDKKYIKVSTQIDGKSVLYIYNIKTKKLKKQTF